MLLWLQVVVAAALGQTRSEPVAAVSLAAASPPAAEPLPAASPTSPCTRPPFERRRPAAYHHHASKNVAAATALALALALLLTPGEPGAATAAAAGGGPEPRPGTVPELPAYGWSALSDDPAVLSAAENGSHYLAFALQIRDEAEYVREWLEYHRRLGVTKFYVFDHASDPPLLTRARLWDEVQTGLVEYYYFHRTHPARHRAMGSNPNYQLDVMDRVLDQFGHRHRFIGFLDVDEFVVLREGQAPDLPSFLREFEPHGGLAVNWLWFGTSGHARRPHGGVLRNYRRCHRSEVVKLLVNPRWAVESYTAHSVVFVDEAHGAVNSNHVPVVGHETPGFGAYDRIVIHHYFTKSAEEFARKLRRGGPEGDGTRRSSDDLALTDARAVLNCTEAIDRRLYQGLTVH